MKEILYLVIPCYNEEEVLPETTRQLEDKMMQLINQEFISEQSKVVYVNDGSKDNTWQLIRKFNSENDLFLGINLSRNKGHQNAVLAGIMTVKQYADVIITLDADLQDSIDAIDEMIQKYDEGNDVVYGVRSSRKKDTFFKRKTAELFYKFMLWMGVDIVYNHADYRLMSKRVCDELANYKEVNLFLRGIVPLIGFPSEKVYYERNERFAGESKYPLKKMLAFAINGITSFSVKPIRFVFWLGIFIFLISIAMLIYTFVRFCMGLTVSGWSSLSISIWALGGIQLLSIGIIGEYIGKIYLETKERPKFCVQEFLNVTHKDN